VPLVKISWTIPAAATSLTAAPQLDLRAPRLGVGLGTVSATLTSGGNPVAGQQITFTADAPLGALHRQSELLRRSRPATARPKLSSVNPVGAAIASLAMESEQARPLRAALEPSALKSALVPRRPVFGNPWDSAGDMLACFVAVSILDPLLLWCGGELMSAIFGFGSRWPLGVFMIAALVGAAGFMTIVGRERTSLSVDVLAISAWLVLGLVVAPVVGLAPPIAAAIVLYGVLLLSIFVYVLRFGRWKTPFLRTVSWPVTWSLLALLFAFSAHHMP
jgi:hypothetical protein